jgi:hypothetical protein
MENRMTGHVACLGRKGISCRLLERKPEKKEIIKNF